MFLMDERHRQKLRVLAADMTRATDKELIRDQCEALLSQPHAKNRKGAVASHTVGA